jgi:hypothetical protein
VELIIGETMILTFVRYLLLTAPTVNTQIMILICAYIPLDAHLWVLFSMLRITLPKNACLNVLITVLVT